MDLYTLEEIKRNQHELIEVFGENDKYWLFKEKQEYPANIVNDLFGINESRKLSIYIGIYNSTVFLLH